MGSYEKAAPEHRVNPANPNVDIVSFGLRIVFHDPAQPIRWTTPRPFLAPGLKYSPYGANSILNLFQQHGLESVRVKRDDDFICVWRSDNSDVDTLRDIGGLAERLDLDCFHGC